MPDVNRDPTAAWSWLAEKGGIEVHGRDLDLVMSLKERLDPEANSLEEALSAASMTRFLNSFFGVVSPYVGMMRDLLAYFDAAEATEGPTQWVLVLGEAGEELEINLDAFKQWIHNYDQPRQGIRTVPVLDYGGLWDVRKHFFVLAEGYSSADVIHKQPRPAAEGRDVSNWLKAYEHGEYLPLPAVVDQAISDPGPVGDVAALLVEIYSAILAVARNSAELSQKGQSQSRHTNDF